MRTLARILLLSLLAAGCGGVKVRQDYDPGADLGALRNFNWQSAAQKPTGNELADSPLLNSRIRAAVERELLAKGHRKVDRNPDYLLTYSYSIQDKPEYDSHDARVGVGVGGGSHGGFGSVGVGINLGDGNREQATLVIDMLEPAGGDLLWRGVARQSVAWNSDPEESSARINKAVAAILAQFPPSKNK
ncbi:MAG TPA: DUF4136 domain-containing protein [Gammaproteobacteria bacterium]|nr:DUF4136 domain-containing protein [Gammaproteobacteria bacterium]